MCLEKTTHSRYSHSLRVDSIGKCRWWSNPLHRSGDRVQGHLDGALRTYSTRVSHQEDKWTTVKFSPGHLGAAVQIQLRAPCLSTLHADSDRGHMDRQRCTIWWLLGQTSNWSPLCDTLGVWGGCLQLCVTASAHQRRIEKCPGWSSAQSSSYPLHLLPGSQGSARPPPSQPFCSQYV